MVSLQDKVSAVAVVSGERHAFWSTSDDEWCPVPADAHTVKYLYTEHVSQELGVESGGTRFPLLQNIQQRLWLTATQQGRGPLAGTIARWFQAAAAAVADALHGLLLPFLNSQPADVKRLLSSAPICWLARVSYPGMATFSSLPLLISGWSSHRVQATQRPGTYRSHRGAAVNV